MSTGKTNSDLDRVIADYFKAVESGKSPNRDELFEQLPELVDDLRSFFASHDRLRRAVDSDDETLPTTSPTEEQTLPTTDPNATDPTLAATIASAENVTLPPTGAANPAAPVLSTNVKYFGDYELLEEIARGGMGIVYKARQVSLNRIVALKMILVGQLAGAEDVARFHAEAEAAANLDHPGIVPIHEVGEHEGQHYFSMGFVDGESLADRIKEGPLPQKDAAEYTQKIAVAIAHAHQHGVIHRDLKPANVLLDQNDQPKVTDFGLAKKIEGDSGLTATGQILGTPSYMPPEQASGKIDEITETADVYSLGAILYTLLTGRPPFQAPSHMDTLLQVLERNPVSPSSLNPKIVRDLETICLKCLEKDRRRRYESLRSVSEELERFLNGTPILARPISRAARGWRWCKRNPAVASLSALTALSLLAGTAVSINYAIVAQNRAVREAVQRVEAERARTEAEAARDDAKNESRRAYRNFYLGQMYLAQRDWEGDRVGDLLKRLEVTRPEQTGGEDIRGFEWYYWDRLCHSELCRLEHGATVTSLRFSSDGKRIVSGGLDGTVKVWDAIRGNETLAVTLQPQPTCVAFSPDTKRIVAGNEEGRITVLDAETGSEIQTLTGHDTSVLSVSFSPEGDRMVSGDKEGTLKVWDASARVELFTAKGHQEPIVSTAFSPEGDRIAAGGGKGTIKVWDVQTGRETLAVKAPGSAKSVSFSPDRQWIAASSGLGRSEGAWVWDATTGKEIHKLDIPTSVPAVAFSPDGKQIASTSGSGTTLSLWDAVTASEMLKLIGHTGHVRSVVFSPDGRRVASGSEDGTVRTWEVTRGTGTVAALVPDVSNWKALSPDGKRVVSVRQATVSLWAADSGSHICELAGHNETVNCVEFSPDGKRIVSGDYQGVIKVWVAQTGQESLSINAHNNRVVSSTFSPDGERIASTSWKGATVKVWDVRTGAQTLALKGFDITVSGVAFSPDGNRIASIDERGAVKVWDARSGRKLLTAKEPQQRVNNGGMGGWGSCRVAFSPDAKRLAFLTNDSQLEVFDLQTERRTLTLNVHNGYEVSVAFSPDGERIAATAGAALYGEYQSTVTVWHSQTGSETLTLRADSSLGWGVAFSPDGKQLSKGGRRVEVWDARPWTPQLKVDYEARGLLNFLHAKVRSREELREKIHSDQTITEAVRRRALTWAEASTIQEPTIQEPTPVTKLATLKQRAVFGFPQQESTVLCNTNELRFSVWSNAEYLSAQAIVWNDDDDSLGTTRDGKKIADWSALMLDVDADGQRTPRVDRNYTLNPLPDLQGLYYVMMLDASGSTSGLKGDSKGRGSIRYVRTDAGKRVRVDTYLIPLQEFSSQTGDTIRLAYWGSSPESKAVVNSTGYQRTGQTFYSHQIPQEMYHEFTLREGRDIEIMPEDTH